MRNASKGFLFIVALITIFAVSQLASAVEIMPVKDVKPGMRGYGYTVYKGTVPERFEFEVIGVDTLWNTTTDSPVILVKLTAGPAEFPPEKTGVVAGMSGSPMYINGKLIGALAYGFGDMPKDAIAGVQPAENMLNPYSKVKKVSGKSVSENIFGKSYVPLVLSLPPQMADLFSKVDRFKNDSFFKENFVIKASYKSLFDEPADDNGKLKLRPGSSLNVYLVKGDVNIAANGTVTMVDGKTIYAFGHSFFGSGETEMYFHQATVLTTFSDYIDSYKMVGGDAGDVEGTITDDYYSAIKGEIGKTPKMIKMSIDLEGVDGARAINVEVAKLPGLTVKMVDMLVFSAIYADGYLEVGSLPAGTSQEMIVKSKIKFDSGLPSIETKNEYGFKFYGTHYQDDLIWAADDYATTVDSIIAEMGKKGALKQISSIDIDVSFAEVKEESNKPTGAKVESLKAKVSTASPGDKVLFDVTVSAFEGKKRVEYTTTVSTTVPSDAKEGTLMWADVGSGVSFIAPLEIKDLSVEETINYYNHFLQPGLFLVLEYKSTASLSDKSAQKGEESNIKFQDSGSSAWNTSPGNTFKMKKVVYPIPSPPVVGEIDGTANANVSIVKKPPVAPAAPAPQNPPKSGKDKDKCKK